jgi:putative addiction module component (TIGR02574 family)
MNILAPEEVARLSVRERLALIERLWDRLDDSGVPVTPAEQAELARRLATFEDDRADEVTWDQLNAELSARRP